MANLRPCLIQRLNNMPELGTYQFGDELQTCLNDIVAGSGDAVSSLGVYADEATFVGENGKIDGSIFFDSTTQTIKYCSGGNWIEIDMDTTAATIAANTTQIAFNTTTITNLAQDITNLQNAILNHMHDGVDSAKIDVKNLDTSSANAGDIFKADGAGGVICEEPSGASLKVSESGGQNILDVECINFDTEFVTLVDAGGGQVDVTMGDLTSFSDDFYAHDHSNGTTPRVPAEGIDSTGLATANSHVLCNDGLGKAVWTPKTGGTPDYFVEKYIRSFNQSGVPTTGVTDINFDVSQNLGSTTGVCTQLQTGSPGCIEILAEGMYDIDTLIHTTAHVIGSNSRYYITMVTSGANGETQNIGGVGYPTQGTGQAIVPGSATRYFAAGDIVCFKLETNNLASGTSIGSIDTYVALSKVG